MAVITGHHKPVQWTVVNSRICCYKLAEKSTTQAADTHDQTGQQTPEEEEETCPGEEGDTQKEERQNSCGGKENEEDKNLVLSDGQCTSVAGSPV